MKAKIVTREDPLRLHKDPRDGSITLDLMPKGDVVELLGPVCDGYSQVRWKGITGWAWSPLLEPLSPPAPPPVVEPNVPGWIWWALAAVVALCVIMAVAMAWGAEVPDSQLTPGVTRHLSMSQICHTKWGRDRRFVTAAMKAEVFARYGLSGNHDRSCTSRRHFEIDHLISRELGGADEIENLWPQCYGGTWNAVMKDRLENRLHREVCARRLSLRVAQRQIAADWRKPYRHYFGEPE